MLDLKKIKAQPHSTTQIFKLHKIPVSSIAIALDLSYSHVSSILSGIRKPTAAVDLQLKQLAKRLEEEVRDVGK